MMTDAELNIRFQKLPLWKGVSETHSPPDVFPFYLSMHEKGYLHQTTPQEIQSKIVEAYQAKEYEFISTPPGESSWGDKRGAEFMAYLREVAGPLKGKKVLDIGGGTTHLGTLCIKQDKVREYVIMDPAIHAACEVEKLRVIQAYFSEETIPSEKFDLIVSMNCLEHVSDPVQFFRGIQTVLNPIDGKAVIICPDNERQLLKGDFNALLHEHLSYFTSDTIRRVAHSCGLELLDYRSENDVFFGVFGLSKGAGKLEQTRCEKDNLLLSHASKSFCRSQDYFYQMMQRCETSNVAFHGACNGLNNLLSLSDLSMAFIDRIIVFDGDENKVGKYLPMCPNPIRALTDESYKQMDFIIIAAMSYFDQINEFIQSYHGIPPEKILPVCPV